MRSLETNILITCGTPTMQQLLPALFRCLIVHSFMQFWGHLAMTFNGRSRSGKTSSQTSPVEVSSCVISEEAGEHKLSRNSQQRQSQINLQAKHVCSLETQNQRFSQRLEP